jgi:hypothetical protein
MRVLTAVYALFFVMMVVFAVMSFLGVFSDPFVDPGM